MLKATSKFINKWWTRLLDVIGDIKVFKYPFFLVYDPSFFQMTGQKIEEAMKILQPGDIILRGFDCYLDGHFIDGDYSHGAIYVGDNTIIHAISPTVCKIHSIDFMECDRIVILRPSEGVEEAIKKAHEYAEKQVPYDFYFEADDDSRLYCFELVAACYSNIKFEKFEVKKIFGLIKRQAYLSKSFLDSDKLEKVFECNPRKRFNFVRVTD